MLLAYSVDEKAGRGDEKADSSALKRLGMTILEELQRRASLEDFVEAVFATELEPASSFFRAECVMKETIPEVKLIERGKIEIERSCIALDGKNGSGVAAKNSGERPVCQPSDPPVTAYLIWHERKTRLKGEWPSRPGSGCVAIMFLMFFASRPIEKQGLNEGIERCRLASRFVGTLASTLKCM